MTIDYALAAKRYPKQKAALTRAINSKDRSKVLAACCKAVAEWNEVGAWPDEWSRWQRALGDVGLHVQLEDLP